MTEQTTWPREGGKIAMAVLGRQGDVKKIWDRSQEDEVDDARATFDRLRQKGYLAFHVDKKGEKGEQMTMFDPSAERMIMVPQMQGG